MKTGTSNSPVISVITVTYNAGGKIEPTILSVLDQSYKNIEFIVIDGGSTDGTIEIIEKYRNEIDYYVSEPDKGVYDAMNKGIQAATGAWIYFLGAGDVLLNVLKDIAPLLKNTASVYYGNVLDQNKRKVYDGKFSSFKLAVNNICHQSIFYPSDILSQYRFNTNYKLLADHDLNMRCYGDKNISFEYVPEVICIYEGGGLSDSLPDEEFFKDKIKIIRANFSWPVYVYASVRRAIARIIKKRPG